jgi:hypothetical protein
MSVLSSEAWLRAPRTDELRGRGAPLLSRPSVETMTTVHLTPGPEGRVGVLPRGLRRPGWGFDLGVVTRRESPSGLVGLGRWLGHHLAQRPVRTDGASPADQCGLDVPSAPGGRAGLLDRGARGVRRLRDPALVRRNGTRLEAISVHPPSPLWRTWISGPNTGCRTSSFGCHP